MPPGAPQPFPGGTPPPGGHPQGPPGPTKQPSMPPPPGFPGMPAGPQQQQQQQAAFGGDYLPTATAAPADAVRVVSPAALVHRLRSAGSTWMAADDINYILRIQHMATHSGVPYVEDFYFQVGVWGGGLGRVLWRGFVWGGGVLRGAAGRRAGEESQRSPCYRPTSAASRLACVPARLCQEVSFSGACLPCPPDTLAPPPPRTCTGLLQQVLWRPQRRHLCASAAAGAGL